MKLTLENIINAYGIYWEHVKDKVDEEGWVYNHELPFLLDTYFESNTSKEIDREEDYSCDKWYNSDKVWRGFKR